LAPVRIEPEILRGAHSQVPSQYHQTNPLDIHIIVCCCHCEKSNASVFVTLKL
jgi:hypothetical protein